jgi:microcystin-dependent protein
MTAGDHVGTIQADENKSHTHGYGEYSAIVGIKGSPSGAYGSANVVSGITGDENRPANIYFKFIIRVDDQFPAITDETSDGYYEYTRTWDETIPVDSDYFGRQALELRKLRADTEELLNNFFPPGLVAYWPNAVAPTGYAELNGQELEITTYPDLYEIIGDLYGVASVSTKFKMPDLRGIFIRAQDNGAGVDSLASSRTCGDAVGSTQEDGLKTHSHTYSRRYDSTLLNFPIGSYLTGTYLEVHPGTTTNTPLRTVDTHPKNMYLMAIMKVLPA